MSWLRDLTRRLLIGTVLGPACALAQSPAAGGADIPLQMGISVRPETVTVGQPFLVTLRVRSARGASIAFPPGPDSLLPVEAVDPPLVRDASDSAGVERTAVYRLVAWDTGAQQANLEALVVTLGGAERRVSVAGARVYVRSVLPADTSLHVPKPAQEILPAARPWWHWLVAALAVLLLGAMLLWWWLRRRRRAFAPGASIDALEYAEREFARVELLGLLEAGERGRYVALVVEVLRQYLGSRIEGALPALTSAELLEFLRRHPEVRGDRLARLLAEADLIKFARRSVTLERARELGKDARSIVRDVDRALTPADSSGRVPEAA